eukprot:12395590-Alexandrium_andersonii.AAC.1
MSSVPGPAQFKLRERLNQFCMFGSSSSERLPHHGLGTTARQSCRVASEVRPIAQCLQRHSRASARFS